MNVRCIIQDLVRVTHHLGKILAELDKAQSQDQKLACIHIVGQGQEVLLIIRLTLAVNIY